MFEIRKNLDLRKILGVTKIFLKSRFHCTSKLVKGLLEIFLLPSQNIWTLLDVVLVCHVPWVIGFESGIRNIDFGRRYYVKKLAQYQWLIQYIILLRAHNIKDPRRIQYTSKINTYTLTRAELFINICYDNWLVYRRLYPGVWNFMSKYIWYWFDTNPILHKS